MVNVQYPFSDLASALLSLLQTLKEKDWNKTSILNKYKVSSLAVYLLPIYIESLNQPNKEITFDLPDSDTEFDFSSIAMQIKILEELIANSPMNDKVSEKAYSYCWLAQQYIHQALNNQDLLQRKFYFLFLNKVMQTLANHYQCVEAIEGTIVKIEIVGEAGGVWAIEKVAEGWKKTETAKPEKSLVYIDQQIAWLLFTDALHVNEIGQFYQIIGDKQLGGHFLSLRTDLFF